MITLPLVLPPLPRDLLMRGQNGIPARIRHQITHHRRLNVNGFHRSMNRVAGFQRADFFFGEGEGKFNRGNVGIASILFLRWFVV